ncbi:hypothetical protein SSX86_015381 [Deinandra increscens subsp. villosa]|uniref:Transcription repressor n=1 Tax=Deinandra increscens subsp. villosa TaxID=3103831 RepID=A0AAP0D791_9ASTR
MGNYRFRLSDMLPNAWFYKLRDMSKSKSKSKSNHHRKPPFAPYHSSSTTTKPPQSHHLSQPRTSLYYTPKLSQLQNSPKSPFPHDPPRKSSKRPTPSRKTIYKPSPKHTSLTESTHTLQDFFHSPTTNQSPSSESTQSGLTTCTCRLSSPPSDIIIDVTANFSPEKDLKLPPIITQPAKPKTSLSGKKVLQNNQIQSRKSVSGVKLRSNSPKLAFCSKRTAQKCSSRSNNMNSGSFAIVKSSVDPQKDFMESMKEMIVENNIRSSKGLEDLLACYLSLNSDEYHDVIVKAFEQLWWESHQNKRSVN